jgi:DNA (cytosine-5)-methyltransferase 1
VSGAMRPPADALPTLVDLFCGCGGLSAGFAFPGLQPRFRVVAGVDWDRPSLKTFKHNHPTAVAYRADLSALSETEVRGIARRLDLKAGRLDVLHASPPCQPFRAINRSLADTKGDAFLFRSVIRWAGVLRPRAVTYENVIGMKVAHEGELYDELIRGLEGLDYSVASGGLDAARFGVPQHRVRLFIVAYRNDVLVSPRLPSETHGPSGSGLRPLVSSRQAIGDLPPTFAGAEEAHFLAQGAPVPPARALESGEPYSAIVSAPVGHNVTHHWSPALSALSRRRIEALAPGQAIDHLPKRLQPRMGYRGAYGRLHPDRPATTITGNCDHPSRGRFSHYDQVRGITLREAARLQSFPDAFHWPVPHRSHIAQQIGNAVPPLLAHALARSIASDLGYLSPEEALDLSSGTVRVSDDVKVP